MWILTRLQPGATGETHYLHPGKEHVVGRKNCDIILSNDQSISRAHAHLLTTDQALILKDTSKYGTFVNSQRLTENTPVNLKSGDNVTFGLFESKFSVDHQKPVVCSSCLDNDGKVLLSQSLAAVGGNLVSSWSHECTHLVMTSVKVTIKTICALLCCRPIVKPEFFSELCNAIEQKLPPPKADSFLPELDEPSLSIMDVNLGVIPGRRQLFTGKTFIFLSAKQLKRLSAAVSFGGGRTQLLEEGSVPRELLECPQNCVIDVTTSSSQALLPSSTTEWAKSVKNVVQRKGLRVITESEIGLAAIHASCDQHCNPSHLIPDTEPISKLNPRIQCASLSQSVAVDETLLPAASQNITAYAVNTEPSHGTQQCKVPGVMAVGETPEKKGNQNTSQVLGSKLGPHKRATHCVVDDTVRSSFNAAERTDKQKATESKPGDPGSSVVRPQQSHSNTSGCMKRFPQKYSPQKLKTSAQASPQKQATLTSFFQPVKKKRPLEDEPFNFMSEPKRPILESSINIQAPNTPHTSKETYRVPAAVSQAPVGSAQHLFPEQSGGQTDSVHEESKSRKRKGIEEEIGMDELESIMSEDMDGFDESPSDKGQHAKTLMQISKEKKQDNVVASSASKRQRVLLEGHGTNRKQQPGLEKEPVSFKNGGQKCEPHVLSIKIDQLNESRTAKHKSVSPPVSSSNTCKNLEPFEDIGDVELLNADICQPKEENQHITIKQEVKESRIDEDLPNKLVIVEFRSLTVSAAPKARQQKTLGTSNKKNFKCFRKRYVPGGTGAPHIIGGSDLLVHNRGKNSDVDEWLKDAIEEEHQSKQEQKVGDDLFRYNPTKLSKRR